MRMTIYTIFLLLILAVGTMYYSNIQTNETIMQEQEEEIQQLKAKADTLQKQNKVLTEDNESLYADYSILRDELWNLKNNLEKEMEGKNE